MPDDELLRLALLLERRRELRLELPALALRPASDLLRAFLRLALLLDRRRELRLELPDALIPAPDHTEVCIVCSENVLREIRPRTRRRICGWRHGRGAVADREDRGGFRGSRFGGDVVAR